MALSSAVVNVTATATPLHTAGPTQVWVKNLGGTTIFVGSAGAQLFPVYEDQDYLFTIGSAEVLNAKSEAGTEPVAVLTN